MGSDRGFIWKVVGFVHLRIVLDVDLIVLTFAEKVSQWAWRFIWDGSIYHIRYVYLIFCAFFTALSILHSQDGDNFFFETNIEFCRNKDRYEPGMNCFYMPYSKCTIRDATANVGMYYLRCNDYATLILLTSGLYCITFPSGGDVNRLRTYYMGDFRYLHFC